MSFTINMLYHCYHCQNSKFDSSHIPNFVWHMSGLIKGTACVVIGIVLTVVNMFAGLMNAETNTFCICELISAWSSGQVCLTYIVCRLVGNIGRFTFALAVLGTG